MQGELCTIGVVDELLALKSHGDDGQLNPSNSGLHEPKRERERVGGVGEEELLLEKIVGCAN